MSEPGADSGLPTPPPPPPNMAPPPGYVAYGGANQGAFGTFQRVGGLAKSLTFLVGGLIVMVAVSAGVLASLRGKAQDFINGEISQSEFEDSSGASALTSLLTSALFIATVVLTMIWMFRLAKNAQVLGRIGTWGPGWAVGGWFLPPLVLYVIPYLMFRDLWKASDPQSGHDWRRNPVGTVVHVWWVLYGLAPLIFFSVTVNSFRVGTSTRDLAENIDDTFALSLLSSLVQALAGVAFLMMVRQLSARYRQITNEV